MTQLSSFDRTRQFAGSDSSGVAAAASWLSSFVRRPDVLVVLGMCAVGLTLTLIAVSTLPGLPMSLSEASMIVGP